MIKARMFIAANLTILVLLFLHLIITGHSSYQNDEVAPAEVRHYRHRRAQSPGTRSSVPNNDEDGSLNELESQMVLPSARQDGDDDDGDDACQTRLKDVVPKSLTIRRLVRCDNSKKASKRLNTLVPLVHLLHMPHSPPRVNLSRRFLADASSSVRAVDTAGAHASRFDATTSSESATSDQSAFHIDYSGPKTHPPKNN